MEFNGWPEYLLNGTIIIFSILTIGVLIRLLLARVFPKDTE